MKKKKTCISEQRVRDILEMFFEGELYDCVVQSFYSPMAQKMCHFVTVRYCDGRPAKEVRRILARNLRGWSVLVHRVYSAEAVADELYRLCTVEGWRLRRDGPDTQDTPEVAMCVAQLRRDGILMFDPNTPTSL